MTTIATIFQTAREVVPSAEPNFFRYIESFEKLRVGGAVWHGQVNIAKDLGYVPQGAWVVTIYLHRQPRGLGSAWQYRAKTAAEALAEVERLATEWAANQEAITP
jgi:hypothetical protein